MARPQLSEPHYKLVLRGGVYYAKWWRTGAWHRKSLKTADEIVARDRLALLSAPPVSISTSVQAALQWRKKRTCDKGAIGEAIAMAWLLDLGASVFIPWGHDHRCDLVISHGNIFRSVQIKVGCPTKNGLVVNVARSQYSLRGRSTRVLLPSECDLLIAYCPSSGECYFTQVTGVHKYRLYAADKLTSLAPLFEATPPDPESAISVASSPIACAASSALPAIAVAAS
jgi:PD-(D/E)XK endonuclease